MIKSQEGKKKMKNKLVGIMVYVNTMTVAGLSALAKKDKVISDSEVREFIQGWGDQLNRNLSKLTELLDDD